MVQVWLRTNKAILGGRGTLSCIPLPLTVVLFGSHYKSIGLTLHQQLIEQASLFQLEGWRARVISLEPEVNVCGPVTAGRHPFQVL